MLVNTCRLRQILPYGSTDSLADVCPIVSTSAECVALEATTVINADAVIIPGGAEVSVDNIKSKSGSAQVRVDVNKGAHTKSINLILTFMAVLSIRLY